MEFTSQKPRYPFRRNGQKLDPARIFAALLAMLSLPGCSGREAYPNRPIVLICPWAAGGGTDRVSRQVAVLLEQEIGVPVNVINATGGSGVTGHNRGALARADGYTLTMITVELNMLHWRGLTSINYHDFQPLMQLNRDDAALFVRADAPWASLSELENAIRARPGGFKASGTAQGGIWHVSLAGWLDASGLQADDVNWISINGSGPSLQELLSGGIQMVCCSLPEAQTLLEAGEVRCLGVMADRRLKAFAEVPTFREQGYDWSIGGWRGLALPPGVPAERFETLLGSLERVVQSAAYKAFMETNGFNSSILGPEEFTKSLAEYDETFRDILTSDAFRSVRRARYGPYVFPTVLVVALILVFVAILMRGGWRSSGDQVAIRISGFRRIALVVGWVVTFVLLLNIVGYVITATLLLMAMLLIVRVRWPVAIALSFGIVPLSYQVFAVGLRVPLPWGWLGW